MKTILLVLFFPAIVGVWMVLIGSIASVISLIPVWLLAYVMFACIGWIGFYLTYKP